MVVWTWTHAPNISATKARGIFGISNFLWCNKSALTTSIHPRPGDLYLRTQKPRLWEKINIEGFVRVQLLSNLYYHDRRVWYRISQWDQDWPCLCVCLYVYVCVSVSVPVFAVISETNGSIFMIFGTNIGSDLPMVLSYFLFWLFCFKSNANLKACVSVDVKCKQNNIVQ